ncbi:microtubule-associated tumor suppressor candidate 2 [Myripristis murdjan]|uniref:microtubule-associated tumor suppressor candidate 2 n=1 Tax=Myripristis murdjan TaxID=586833 RepID=UPI001175F44A|nr:microtubule-associated tumor suppressor candidate 2-like [Myripristis murdjan]
MSERGEPFGQGELRNNNPQDDVLPDGDANANEIRTQDGGGTGDTRTPVSLSRLTAEMSEQDKVIIWGTDSQCDDPELAEFEMLECQELDAYLVEEGEDFVGLGDRKELFSQPSSCSRATVEPLVAASKSKEQRKPVQRGASEQEVNASHVSESRGVAAGTEFSSETDVFVSCLSTMSSLGGSLASALDTAGRTQTTDSWHVPSGPYRTISEDLTLASQSCNTISDRGKASHQAERHSISSGISTIHRKDVDVNLNSAVLSEAIEAQKQGSLENALSSSSSSLERRKPWGSPSRPATPTSPKTTCSPKRRPPGSPAKVQGIRALSLERSDSPQRGSTPAKQPGRVCVSSGIPKPVSPQQKEPDTRRSSPPQKPKNVRPKIITYVRKNPQAKPQMTDAPHEASTLPLRVSSYPSPPTHKVGPQHKGTSVLCSSNLLFDKYRQEMHKTSYYPPGMKAPSSSVPQKLSGKSESFHGELPDKYLQEQAPQEAGGVYRSPRALRPQLGLGAVTRQPAAKTRAQQTGQRSAATLNQSAQATGAPTHSSQDPAGDIKEGLLCPETAPKSLLLKPGQSGLRPPGFSALPPARLAAFGFVRSGSVSSVSSNQSNDSTHSDPCRPSQHPGSGSEDTPLHKATAPPSEAPRVPSRGSPQPPNAPSLQRRSLPPPRCSPLASRKETPKDTEAVQPPASSPKRFAVVSPKPQSPVRGRAAVGRGAIRPEKSQESDRALVQKLRERCEEQAWQLQSLQAQLKKASLGLEVFAITTQHFCQKSESAIVKERELSLELARIRDEVAFSVARWEHLQQDKEELERRFEAELQGLRAQQQSELGALEEQLRAQHTAERERLQAQQRAELKELRIKQQEQIEDMSENHEASLMEMETAHNDTLATLQEEHARTVKNLKMAHEQQRKSLEEEFEKLRLSLQDQVDTLTFQNRSLRDRAKRFEEALRKSTDEQIVDALAPYQHIEEDLKSLKEVLEMKNQQIHQQELKISELEKMAEKNVYLEERVQVLQQQNEDLKARIDKNLAVSRQLSEENANLQVHVEKESNEKKRLSRTNEELLWRLQTGELSPRMSPTSSPIHRSSSGTSSPARPHSYHQ